MRDLFSSISRARDGFTLVEVLVASGVGAIVLLIVIQAFSVASSITTRTGESLHGLREGRAAMQMILRDLRFVRASQGGAEIPMLVIEPVEEAGGAFYALVNTGKEDVLVGYYCKWEAEAKCYALMRGIAPDASPLLRHGSAGSLSAPFTTGATGSPVVYEEQLAAYVWDFTVAPCSQGVVSPVAQAEAYGEDLPAVVEVRFKIIAPKAAEKLRRLPVTPATWTDPNDPIYKAVILPNQQEFVVRGRILSAQEP